MCYGEDNRVNWQKEINQLHFNIFIPEDEEMEIDSEDEEDEDLKIYNQEMEMLNPKVKELMNKRVIQGNIKHVITFRMVFQTKKEKVTIKKLAWLTKQMVLTDLRTSKGKESKPSINKLICQDIIATKTKWNETMVNDIYWSNKSTVSKFQTAMTISIILDTEENSNQEVTKINWWR